MDSGSSRKGSTLLRKPVMLAVLVALMVGLAAGPATAAGASAAWVRIKNWPAVMNVLVTNWPSVFNVRVNNNQENPVPVDHAPRTLVHLYGWAQIVNTGYNADGSVFYTVPEGRYLTVTSISANGGGLSILDRLEVDGSDQSVVVVPFTLQQDGGQYFLSGAVGGEEHYGPGTALNVSAGRNTNPNSSLTAEVYLDGYLTSKP